MDKFIEMGRKASEAGEIRIAPLVMLNAEGGIAAIDAWYVGYDAARGITYVPGLLRESK